MAGRITVKTLDSQNYQFDADENWTVQQFKDHIESTVNVSSNEQRLIFCGRVLQDDKKLTDYDCCGKVIHLVRRPPPTLDNSNHESPNTDSNDNNNNHHGARNIYRVEMEGFRNARIVESTIPPDAIPFTDATTNPYRHYLAVQQAIFSRIRGDGITPPAATTIEPLSMTNIDRHLHNAARLHRITYTTINECMARIATFSSTGPRSESEVNLDVRRVITTASSHTDLQRDDEMQTSNRDTDNQSAQASRGTVDDIALGVPTQSNAERVPRSFTNRQSLTTDDLPPSDNRTIQGLVPEAVMRSRTGDPLLSTRQRGESELDRYLSILYYSDYLQIQFQNLARRYRHLIDMSRRGGLIVPQASASTSTEPEHVDPPPNDQTTTQQTQTVQTSSTLMNEARILGMYIPRIMHHLSHLQHALSDFSVDFARGRLLLCSEANARNGQRSANRINVSTQNPPAPQSASTESNSSNVTATSQSSPHAQSFLNQRDQPRDAPQPNPILEGTVTITGTAGHMGPLRYQTLDGTSVEITHTGPNGQHLPVSTSLSFGPGGPQIIQHISGTVSGTNQQDTTTNSTQTTNRPIRIVSGRMPLPFDYYLPCFSPWANHSVTSRATTHRVVRDASGRWRTSRDTGTDSSPSNNPTSDTTATNTAATTTNNNSNINNDSAGLPRDAPGSPNLEMGLTEVVSNIVGSIFRIPQQSAQQTGASATNANQEPLLNFIPELALNAASQILGGVLGIPPNNQSSTTPQSQSGIRPQQSSTNSSATVMMDIDIDDSSSSQSESRYQDARDSQSPSTSSIQGSTRQFTNTPRAPVASSARSQVASSSNPRIIYNRQRLVEVMQSHPDWIPIIEADIGVMEQQNGQQFFSDAYLSSIPRKRRRLLASSSNQVLILQPSPSQAITNLLRRAISSSSSPNTESLDQVLSAISSDQTLQSAYEDYIKTAVEARLRSDYDYCPQKFENSSKYFK